MTRRALSPRVSAAAGAAPVISKLDGLPCGAFGSITVLIFSLLAFPALVGGARHVLLQRSKKLRRSLRAVSRVARVLRGWSGREAKRFPCRAGLTAPRHNGTGSFQTARRIHPANLLVKSIAQYIGLVFLTAHNRAGSLRFYMRARPPTLSRIRGVFLPRPTKSPATRPRGAGGSSRGRFFI